MTENAGFPNISSVRPISGTFPAFLFSQIFNFLSDTLTSLIPDHFEWLMGAVPQFVALILEHRLILFVKWLMKHLPERKVSMIWSGQHQLCLSNFSF